MEQSTVIIISTILATTLGAPLIFKLTFAIRKKLGDEKWLAKFKHKTPKPIPVKNSNGLALASTFLVFAVLIGVPILSIYVYSTLFPTNEILPENENRYLFALLNIFPSVFSIGLIISLFYNFFPAARNYNVAKQIKAVLQSKDSIETIAKKYDCQAYNNFTIKRYIKILIGVFLLMSPFYVLLYFQ